MSKIEHKIVEAPNYIIGDDGVILNSKTSAPITEVAGSVRLTVDGKRKTFKVSDLMSRYYPINQVTLTKEEIQEEQGEVVPTKEVLEEVEKTGKLPETKKDKKPKQVKEKAKKATNNGGKKDKSFFDKVRDDFDKNPTKFDVMKYSKEAGVSYGRIWSIIKLHKANKK